jgi:ABC-type dipeptide/oligopeptide/nickel transport system ATPase subunit
MRIEKLSFHNHVTGWELAPMEFGSVNLLVGVSGVGKTKILEVIHCLQKIAFGAFLYNSKIVNGVEWDVTFSISSDSQYRWHGKFNIFDPNTDIIGKFIEKTYLRAEQNEPNIVMEKLYLNGDCIAHREDGIITFGSQPMPKLSPLESLIKIFGSEDRIMPIIDAWLLVIDSQAQRPERWVGSSMPSKIDGLSLSDIINTNGTLVDRLGLLWINDRQMFDRIKADFIDIFPQVESFGILTTETRFEWSEKVSPVFSLELKEVGVDRWITQSNLSMGMLKTLAHITEIYLLAEGSILLIDEFENSLGVNCIDVVTELLNERKDIQFIFTSHHPYIINKIPMQYWKIITRKGSLVTATNATDYEELSGSKHKIFTQLLNLPAYTEGIQVG